MSRSNSSESNSCNRGRWRPAEDERLKRLVQQYGAKNWNFIAEHIHGRAGKSCRLRWYNQLDPKIVERPFTAEEEELLLALHNVNGNKWAAISKSFPGRTDNSVKNHFHVLMARRKRERYTLSGDRSSNHTSINTLNHNHIPILGSTTRRPASGINNFIFENNRNMGILDLNPRSTQSDTSTTSSELLMSFEASGAASNKPYTCNFINASNHAPSCSLGSYQSFTAPGIPSIGTVVPLPQRFSKPYFSQRTEDYSIECMTDKTTVDEQVQKFKGVPFIDFLGVGSCSASDS